MWVKVVKIRYSRLFGFVALFKKPADLYEDFIELSSRCLHYEILVNSYKRRWRLSATLLAHLNSSGHFQQQSHLHFATSLINLKKSLP